jgi:hypothetical protein
MPKFRRVDNATRNNLKVIYDVRDLLNCVMKFLGLTSQLKIVYFTNKELLEYYLTNYHGIFAVTLPQLEDFLLEPCDSLQRKKVFATCFSKRAYSKESSPQEFIMKNVTRVTWYRSQTLGKISSRLKAHLNCVYALEVRNEPWHPEIGDRRRYCIKICDGVREFDPLRRLVSASFTKNGVGLKELHLFKPNVQILNTIVESLQFTHFKRVVVTGPIVSRKTGNRERLRKVIKCRELVICFTMFTWDVFSVVPLVIKTVEKLRLKGNRLFGLDTCEVQRGISELNPRELVLQNIYTPEDLVLGMETVDVRMSTLPSGSLKLENTVKNLRISVDDENMLNWVLPMFCYDKKILPRRNSFKNLCLEFFHELLEWDFSPTRQKLNQLFKDLRVENLTLRIPGVGVDIEYVYRECVKIPGIKELKLLVPDVFSREKEYVWQRKKIMQLKTQYFKKPDLRIYSI